MTKYIGGDMIEVGQTWRNRAGRFVTVTKGNIRSFEVICEDYEHLVYDVYPNGCISKDGYGKSNYNLVERVTRVYIAGPMTGYPDLNFPAFHAAAAEYRKRGAFVINPAEINGGDAEIARTEKMTAEQYYVHWVRCMKNDINQLMTCDSLVLLDGWQKSRGAKLEHHIARNLGLTITYPEV